MLLPLLQLDNQDIFLNKFKSSCLNLQQSAHFYIICAEYERKFLDN